MCVAFVFDSKDLTVRLGSTTTLPHSPDSPQSLSVDQYMCTCSLGALQTTSKILSYKSLFRCRASLKGPLATLKKTIFV